MALFGRKANQSSNSGDVPPELKPYYVAGSGTPPRRRALRLVLGLLILAIVATAGIAMWRYVRDHPKSPSTLATNQTAQKPKTNTNTQSQGSNNSSTSTGGSVSGPNGQSAPSTPSQQAPSATQSLPSDNNNSPTTPPAPTSGAGAGPAQPLANTGPGETAVFISIVTAVSGTLLWYIRQLRRANS